MRSGPNDASGIVWAYVSFFFLLFSCFLNYYVLFTVSFFFEFFEYFIPGRSRGDFKKSKSPCDLLCNTTVVFRPIVKLTASQANGKPSQRHG